MLRLSVLCCYAWTFAEATINRLLISLEEDEVKDLEQKMASWSDNEDLVVYLMKTYPKFETFLTEEAVALQEEAKKVLG